MWQVRVWWTDWVEIASGPECVFMNSCQSTDRPVWPISQAQVWSRHPQSTMLAVLLDYHHHITLLQKTHSKPLKIQAREKFMCKLPPPVCPSLRWRLKNVRQSYITWQVLLKLAYCQCKITSTFTERVRAVCHGNLGLWRAWQQNLLCLSSRRAWSAATCHVLCL